MNKKIGIHSIQPGKDIDTLPIGFFGRLFYHCLFKVRRIVVGNIEHVFGSSLSDAQKKHLAKAIFTYMARMVKEWYLMHHHRERIKPQIEIRGLEHVYPAIESGKGIIFLTGHLGNWELWVVEGLARIEGLKNQIHVLRRKQPLVLQKMIDSFYRQAGIHFIDKNGAVKAACHLLSNHGTLIFAFDTHVSPDKKQGIEVEFFGKKTGCNRSLAVLAQRTKSVVIPLNEYRINSNQHVIEFYPPLNWIKSSDKKMELYENTRQYNTVIEQFILQHPERWWGWCYRHWY